MRHHSGLRKLNRTGSHRLAMLRNMTVSLLKHESIKTTVPKAKELRRVAERIITLGKKPSVANRRLAFQRLRDRETVSKLFDELGPRFTARNGGYLRILKCGYRVGDNAPMCFVELVERSDYDQADESQLEGKTSIPNVKSSKKATTTGSDHLPETTATDAEADDGSNTEQEKALPVAGQNAESAKTEVADPAPEDADASASATSDEAEEEQKANAVSHDDKGPV